MTSRNRVVLFLKDDETPENGSDLELAALAADYFRKHPQRPLPYPE